MDAENGVHIRALVETDLDQVALLEQQLFGSPWSLAQLHESLRGNRWMWVATQQDVLVGYLVASYGGGVADLLTIGVDARQQRSGIAQQLLSRLFERLRREQADALFLEVRESNAAAVLLYRKCGFESVAVRKGYYPDKAGAEDAIVMRRTGFTLE